MPSDTTGLLISLTIGYHGGFGRGRRGDVKPRRDVRDEWHEVNPIVPSGEPFLETDTTAWYIGDGIRTYRELVADIGPMGYASTICRHLAGEVPYGVVVDRLGAKA